MAAPVSRRRSGQERTTSPRPSTSCMNLYRTYQRTRANSRNWIQHTRTEHLGSREARRNLRRYEAVPMTEQAVTFPSAGLKLSGVVHVPRGLKPSERRGAFLVLHGFGSNKTSSNTMAPTKVLSDLGYVVLRFDMRGCGDSEGEFGRVICLEQVEDTRSALTFLAQHPAVDPQRIGLIGSSFGGAVAIYTGGVDERVAAVISNGGWGDGERKFRGQHPTPQAWKKFTDMLDKGRGHRAKFGKPLMVPRYDIVP